MTPLLTVTYGVRWDGTFNPHGIAHLIDGSVALPDGTKAAPNPQGQIVVPMRLVPAMVARKKGVIIVRSSRVGNGIVARNGEAKDDEMDYVVSDSLNPQKARILVMLALTKTANTKEIQRMFYTY